MNPGWSKWLAAFVFSVGLHLVFVTFVLPDREEIQVAGGSQASVAVLGNAFADSVSAGETTDEAQPVETEVSEIRPVEPETVKPDDAAKPELAARPEPTVVREERPTETVEEAQAALKALSTSVPAAEESKPTKTENRGSSEASTVVEASENAEIAATSAATANVIPDASPVEMTPVEPKETPPPAVDRPVEEVKPVEPGETVVAATEIPVPTPRPKDFVAQAKPPEPTRAIQRKKKRKTASAPPPKKKKKAEERRKKSGAGGSSASDAKRGAADGNVANAENAKKTGKKRKRSSSGNASVSNYPGKIVRKLRRSLRYPRKAKVRGEVHVRFVVSANGSARSIRIVRSSGSPILDKAALDTVRRASPFPAIPREAGRKSWSFTVPLAFRR